MLAALMMLALGMADGGAASGDNTGATRDAGAASETAPPVEVDEVEVRHVTVAVAGSPPFVVSSAKNGKLTGMSLAVWAEVAEALKIEFTTVKHRTVGDAIDAVARGEAHIAVGPISITSERASKVDFTQPYFQAQVGILTSSKSDSAWDRMRPILTRAFMLGLGTLILILTAVGTIVWLAERKANPDQFPDNPVAGIGNGMWFALVTMTSVGYGDRAPITRLGKVVTSAWMLIGVVAMSSITAAIATALTLSQIDETALNDLHSLRDERVAVVRGTPGVLLARRSGARTIIVDDKEGGIGLVAAGKVDAMIYDLPVLQHHLETHPELNLVVYGTSKAADNYGFALPRKSPLTREIDVTLLKLLESEQMSAIRNQWLTE